ncbi:pentapeptide repeat-containing protein [Streptomyces sp. NPDC051366]|uniref:pentapeptide repeat-containing protein n=1 Tax=Streptomyces sp. NPDC051366 TaxID=3365652 RepID=UPI0037A69139
MTPSPLTPLPAPSWRHCGEDATTADPVGCRGRQVPGESLCLAHLPPVSRARYLAALSPGADIDHSGTTFAGSLLDDLLNALRDPTSGRPCFAVAVFSGATFSADARFDRATFSTDASFSWVTFSEEAHFEDARFSADARFDGSTFYYARFNGARFSADASFDVATFSLASFENATFSAPISFNGATFSMETRFNGATFSAAARFEEVTFSADTWFYGTTFSATPSLGPLVCQGRLDLSSAVFVTPVNIEAAAVEVRCVRTRWESPAALRLRYAEVDLSDAVVTQPIAVTAPTAPFVIGRDFHEPTLTNTAGAQLDPGVRIRSLRGVDAAHLVLTNTDLTGCRFFGALHLDQLRLEGETVFARTPVGTDVRRGIPLRWTDRLALAEEHHWRALPEHRPRLRAGWTPAPPEPGPVACPPGPPALAALYRQLRKAFEDGKDEPGAADFYYAEMEMRRLGPRSRRKRAEQGLLTGYWALSGYGLRASRALAWLLLAMTATVLAMMLWGLPSDDPKPESTGTVTGNNIRLTTDTPVPVNPSGPLHKRVSTKRFEKSLRVVVNSVIFRSSGQNLTTRGTYTEMASRLTEPILLGFAALAI